MSGQHRPVSIETVVMLEVTVLAGRTVTWVDLLGHLLGHLLVHLLGHLFIL